MKKLKIAQVAPLWFSIPPKKYGGTEKIIYHLTEELIKRGHKVTLFASGDSKTRAELFAVVKKNLIAQGLPWTEYVWNCFNTARAFEISNKFDILHTHWSWVPFLFSKFAKAPHIHTFHNIPTKKDSRWPILAYFKENINAVFVSKSEKRNCKVKFKRSWVIYNGIDISKFKFDKKGGDYFIWIGKIKPEKGIKKAILATKKIGAKLLLAGYLEDSFKEFFSREIKPYLSQKIRYIGEISQKELSRFYSKAKALLYPIEWEEPFGLVMVEAMACGTPVIAFKRGAVPEIVKDKKTGFVVKSFQEFVEAMKKINEISRLECRKRVEKYFTIEKMVENYEKVYYQILENEKT